MILAEKLIVFVIVGTALNIPFGSYRRLTRKFSVAWLLSIHLPVLFLILLRSVAFHLPVWSIAFSLASAVAGQIIGDRSPRCGLGVRRLLFRQVSPV
ncbi:MAG: hypothetical protein Q8L35_08445 [Actinomycetota bacterium]|nr:hypothetical protein [Actinomycetota bacterium]